MQPFVIVFFLAVGVVGFFILQNLSNSESSPFNLLGLLDLLFTYPLIGVVLLAIAVVVILFTLIPLEKIRDLLGLKEKTNILNESVRGFYSSKGQSLKNNVNVAAATLMTNEGTERTYFALSNLHDLAAEDEKLINKQLGQNTVICTMTDNTALFPVRRLDVDLGFVEIKKSDLEKMPRAMEVNRCTERKIMRQIFMEHRDELDKLKECELHLYTKWEPCLQCYDVLKESKEKLKALYLYYPDMMHTDEIETIPIELNDKNIQGIKCTCESAKSELEKIRNE